MFETIKNFVSAFKGAAYRRAFERGEEPSGGGVVVSRPMAQSVWVYRCIRDISDTLAGVPIRVSREGTSLSRDLGIKAARRKRMGLKAAADNLVESGPAWELLRRPNPNESWKKFIRHLVTMLEHDGSVFILLNDLVGRKPRRIDVGEKSHMQPAVGTGGRVVGWIHSIDGESIPYDLDEIIHIKFANPYNTVWGLSPLDCYALSMAADVSAATWNKTALDNNAEPGVTLSFPSPLSEEQYNRIREGWNARHRGPGNAKKTAVLDCGGKAEAFANTHAEMQYIEGRKFSREEASAAFGVPLERLSGLQNSNRSTGQVGERSYWNQTIVPLGEFITDELTTNLLSRFDAGLEAWFDWSNVPALQEAYRENILAAKDVVAMGATFEQVNEMFDLGYEILPHQREAWIGAGLMPAGVLLAEAAMPEPPMPEGEETEDRRQEAGEAHPQNVPLAGASGSESETGPLAGASGSGKAAMADKAAAERIWANWARSWKPIEKRFSARVKAHFARQCSEMLRRLAKHGSIKASGMKIGSGEIGEILLEWREENRKLRTVAETYIGDAMELGVEQGLRESGVEATEPQRMTLIDSPVSRKIRKRIAAKLVHVDQVTIDRVRESLFEGINSGETLVELAGRIRGEFAGSTMRAMRIARTETSMAASSGRQRAFEESGVSGKVWLSAKDDNVREAHRQAGQDYASPIAIDEPFVVDGEKLMHPGDPSGSPGNVINCRCVHLARRMNEDKAATLRRYEGMKFFGYEELISRRGAEAAEKNT